MLRRRKKEAGRIAVYARNGTDREKYVLEGGGALARGTATGGEGRGRGRFFPEKRVGLLPKAERGKKENAYLRFASQKGGLPEGTKGCEEKRKGPPRAADHRGVVGGDRVYVSSLFQKSKSEVLDGKRKKRRKRARRFLLLNQSFAESALLREGAEGEESTTELAFPPRGGKRNRDRRNEKGGRKKGKERDFDHREVMISRISSSQRKKKKGGRASPLRQQHYHGNAYGQKRKRTTGSIT